MLRLLSRRGDVGGTEVGGEPGFEWPFFHWFRGGDGRVVCWICGGLSVAVAVAFGMRAIERGSGGGQRKARGGGEPLGLLLPEPPRGRSWWASD